VSYGHRTGAERGLDHRGLPVAGGCCQDQLPGEQTPQAIADRHEHELQNLQIGILDITDGTSNTFLVGERASPAGGRPFASAGGIWGFRATGSNVSWGFSESRINTPYPAGTINATTGICCNSAADPGDIRGSLSSLHTGGVFCGFADGGVRFIRDSVDQVGVYERLVFGMDGQVVSGDY
jgi:hypothetical protein